MTSKQQHRFKRILKAIGLSVNVGVAILTLSAAYGGTIDPATTPAGAIMAMTFPMFLLVTLLLLAINLMWWRRMTLINAISLMLCISPILTFCPLNFFRPDMHEIQELDRPTFKLMTYNVLGLQDLTRHNDQAIDGNTTISYILREEPDIVMLQEGHGITSGGQNLNITRQQHQDLLHIYRHHHIDSHGMGILSKYPVTPMEMKSDDIPGLDAHRYDIRIDGHTIHLINVHMQSIGLTRHDKDVYVNITEGDTPDRMTEIRHGILHKLAEAFRARALQAKALRSDIESLEGTVLLCGDFNDIPGCYASRVIAGGDMTDAYRQAGIGPAITYHADKLYFRIDQIFYRGHLNALRAWTGDCKSSDHYPLMCIFEITP